METQEDKTIQISSTMTDLCGLLLDFKSSRATMAYQFNLVLLISFLLLLLSPLTFSSEDPEVEDESTFTYDEGSEKGPKYWSQLESHWEACGNGSMQSPIDLAESRVQVLPNLGKLQRDYKSAHAVVKNRGHDIAVFWKGDAGKIIINGTEYKLLQCHWHTPAEHTINGSRYMMELHAVHASSDGGTAVIGIVYKYGRADRLLSNLLHHINHVVDKEEHEYGILNPGDIKFGSRKYYRYIGSLTVPPCTEGVVWTIVKKVRTVSREQISALREAVHDGYKANSRPVQAVGGRAVFLYTPTESGSS